MHLRTLLFICLASTAVVCVDGHDDEKHGHDNAHYKFEYGVHDPHTHDVKSQDEYRDGKHVTGEYTLKEPDGTYRLVKYRSGPHSGFEAIVERLGHAKHPPVYGKHKIHGEGGTSYVGVIHWGNQGEDEHKDQGDHEEHDEGH